MKVRGFDWDKDNVEHIARHRVTPEDVEEAFEGEHLIRRSRSGRYVLFGRSAAGRYLMVAFILRSGVARIITARDMSRAERWRYK